MKILDRYILTTYLKTFMSVFLILMLIFVLQAIWLYIGELAGKDLSITIIYKFLIFATPTLIPLILPLTILVSSIMVFGSFAENYEFAAMKSTGISLQRAMRGLSIFIVILGFVSFFFANNVIPAANFNFYNLRKNIAQKQPAMVIAEGQFNQLGDINIKVEEKSGDRGQFLKDVVIHQKNNARPGNFTVTTSKSGELKSSLNSNILQLVLYDGNHYDEVQSNDIKQNLKKPFVKSSFEEYIINVDLAGINDVDMDDMSYDNRFNMLNVSSLNYTIDSLRKEKVEQKAELTKTLYSRTNIANIDSEIFPRKDTIFNGEILDLFDTTSKIQLLNLVSNTVNSTSQIISAKTSNSAEETKWLNKHVISLHEKFVLGIACIILFFVGAPLGALIRKGGLGLPMVIAILLFLSYHFIGIFAKNSSQDGSYSSVLGTWLSTLIMLPMGIYLTSRATKDRGLFELSSYLDPIKKFLGMQPDYKVKLADGTLKDYSYITDYNNDRLVDVIKSYEVNNLDINAKRIAYNTMLSNGISHYQMKERGILISDKFLASTKEANTAKIWSRISFIVYLIAASSLVLHFVFANNKFPQYSRIALYTSIVLFIVFLVMAITTFIKSNDFFKHLNIKTKKLNLGLMLIGMPFYMVTHYLIRNKINDDLGRSSLKNIN